MKRIITISILIISAISVAQGQFSKMSPLVRQAALEARSETTRGNHADNRRLTAFVKTTDKEAVISNDCDILVDLGDILVVSIPLPNIEKLASMPEVKRIEARKSSMQILTDQASTITMANKLWETPSETLPGYTGKGVVVGVVDAAIDLTHPTFRTADGQQLRIKAFWDWLDFSDQGSEVDFLPFIGRQFIGEEQILEKKHSADSDISSLQGHGTHTSAIAAGSGYNGIGQSPYIGMTPEADLCLVSRTSGENNALVPIDKYYEFTFAADYVAYKYIFDYAESVGKPCVINISMGGYEDLYQNQLENEAFSRIVGPGKIICASAGNEGNLGTYIHKPKGTEKAGAFLDFGSDVGKSWLLNSSGYPSINLSFYQKSGQKIEWNYDTEGLREYPDSVFVDTLYIEDNVVEVSIIAYPSWVDENNCVTDFTIKAQKDLIVNVPIALTLTGTDIDIEAFSQTGYFTKNSIDPSLSDFDNTHSVGIPGACDDVICVGSASYRPNYVNCFGKTMSNGTYTGGKRSYYSSVGPNKKGTIKPDVMAPGQNVISALNSYYYEALPENHDDRTTVVETFNYDGMTYGWRAMSGTSQAAPVVTGIVALWLQECPTLSPDNIKEIIANTSSHDVTDFTYPNYYYGYGTINAVAGMKYIKEHFSTPTDITTIPTPSQPTYYDLNGRIVSDTNAQHGISIATESGKTHKVVK